MYFLAHLLSCPQDLSHNGNSFLYFNNVFFGPLASCFLVHKIYLTMTTIFCILINFRKMNQPTNIIIIDQGSPIPNYLLSMIKELLKSLVVATETLAPNDCSGK
jgi:hypothetical protein